MSKWLSETFDDILNIDDPHVRLVLRRLAKRIEHLGNTAYYPPDDFRD